MAEAAFVRFETAVAARASTAGSAKPWTHPERGIFYTNAEEEQKRVMHRSVWTPSSADPSLLKDPFGLDDAAHTRATLAAVREFLLHAPEPAAAAPAPASPYEVDVSPSPSSEGALTSAEPAMEGEVVKKAAPKSFTRGVMTVAYINAFLDMRRCNAEWFDGERGDGLGRVCNRCGCYEAFEGLTDECCWRGRKKRRCTFEATCRTRQQSDRAKRR